jgi:hypothetical protein
MGFMVGDRTTVLYDLELFHVNSSLFVNMSSIAVCMTKLWGKRVKPKNQLLVKNQG